jgi:hypothetical protein
MQVHSGGRALRLGGSAPAFTAHEGGVRFVHHQQEGPPPLEFRQARQVSKVSIHGEEGVCDDHSARVVRHLPLQQRRQVGQVGVAVHQQPGRGTPSRQRGAVHDRSVVELV